MFQNRVALVTGGTRGIGKAIAVYLAQHGVSIAVTSLDEPNGIVEELAAMGVKSAFYHCDVSSYADVEQTVKKVVADFGKIDIIVNNAGITVDRLLLAMTESDFDKVVSVNLKGVFNVTKACIRTLIKNRYGRIINIASVVGMSGNAGQANYAASKAGIIGFTKTIAKEYATRGITCNAVAPGFIRTAMTDAMPEEARKAVLASIPVGDYGKPDDVAYAVGFLADDNCSYITGEVIKVDGGMYI